ncbi:NUDIX domain-containing protein [Pacificoceanicola onchidii]|uniref:NUDIX domain-containing protein n=1 Tax=Pacificoceanicola onchidii TaxID=2562685 RepID=UPI0010A62DB5|nr:NUDIX hydrolase [Pacificoceanicola onchidii]
MIRRYGQPPKQGLRYKSRPGVYAILPRNGRLLLTHQMHPEPEFQLPGGGIDPGEHPLTALHREVFEETGWHIANPRRLGAFRRFTFMPEYDLWAEKLCIVYHACPVRAHGAPTEDGHSAHWLTPFAAAQSLGNPGDRAFVIQSFL